MGLIRHQIFLNVFCGFNVALRDTQENRVDPDALKPFSIIILIVREQNFVSNYPLPIDTL